VLVADDALRPLPARWPGELLIASAGPALGYLDPHLTTTRFVELDREQRGPFFRTGDYGWIDDSGEVRFLGRRDRQTKIRGVRIEIDGIEHRVAEVEGVVDVGIVIAGQSSDAQIVAVVQPRPGFADLEPLRVRILENCRQWLQRAEVPALVLFTEAMPVGSSGKKSFAALSEAVANWMAKRANEAASSAPELEPGSVEAKLLALWMEVLNVTETRVSKVGVDDDLFLLGATSLDAIIAAERIATLFGVTCHENEVMLRPTLASQAAFLRETQISAALSRVRSNKREGVGIRLVRKATGPGKSRGAILGMPLIGGDAHYVGSLAAHALSQYDVWAAETNLHGRDMLDEEMWLPVAQEIAGRLLGDVGLAPKGLIGFSIGGFMSWLVNRIMVAAGRAPARLINLDGSIPVNECPAWRLLIADALPSPHELQAAEMLLLHRGHVGRFPIPQNAAAGWADLNVGLTLVPCRTVSHLDFFRPPAMRAYRDTVETYLAKGKTQPDVSASGIAIPMPGGTLYSLLAREERPRSDGIDALVRELPPGHVDVELRLGLLFLALGCGNTRCAMSVVQRLAEEEPDQRDAHYAKVALLAELGSHDAARAEVAAWESRRPQDPVMRKRATFATAVPPSWTSVTSLFSGNSDLALDAAAALGVAAERAATVAPHGVRTGREKSRRISLRK
jgi:hypothetical protein